MERISKEFKDLNKRQIINCGITIGLFDPDDIRNWKEYQSAWEQEGRYNYGDSC